MDSHRAYPELLSQIIALPLDCLQDILDVTQLVLKSLLVLQTSTMLGPQSALDASGDKKQNCCFRFAVQYAAESDTFPNPHMRPVQQPAAACQTP